VLLAAVLGTALAFMSDDMLNLAIPWVARDLRANVTDAQMILDAYYVSLVSCLLVAGSVGDIIGHRRVFVGGILIFSTGALVCAMAPVVLVLVSGRFVQGVGAAMLLTAGLALVSRLNPPQDRGRAVGQFLGLVAAVPALGPFISGVLVEVLSWRWLFVVPLVLPASALIITSRRVPETPLAPERRLNLAGAALAFIALSSLSIALITGAVDLWAPVPVTMFALAMLTGAGLVRDQGRTHDPLLPLGLLRRRVFLGSNLVWLLTCLTSWGAVFFVAVMIQTTLDQTPIAAGLFLTPVYLVMMIGSPLVGKLTDRIGPRWLLLGGLPVYAFGLFLLSRITPNSSLVPGLLGAIFVMATGMAVFTAPLATLTMSALDEADQGVASAFNNVTGQLAGLLAIVLLPLAAGLGGVAFTDPRFALGYSHAMVTISLIAIGCIPLAAWTLTATPRGQGRALEPTQVGG
jgi:EmrB/QacA subfamily drug resistance transporter